MSLVAVLCVLVAGARAASAQPDVEGAWGDAEEFLEEDDEKEGDYEQPPVTAGGMFTKDTYPTAQIDRPLTITEGLFEVRAQLDFDLSKNRVFDAAFSRLSGRYGLRDHIELQIGFDALLGGQISTTDVAAGYHQAAASLGVESALAYDLVNVRATAEIPFLPDRALDFALGLPLRYRATPKLAIVAADRLLTIHTDGRNPDLTVGAGVLYQLTPKLSASARTELTVFGFSTDRRPAVPVAATVQYAATQLVDIGLRASLANVAAESGQLDRRFALLFGRLRI